MKFPILVSCWLKKSEMFLVQINWKEKLEVIKWHEDGVSNVKIRHRHINLSKKHEYKEQSKVVLVSVSM